MSTDETPTDRRSATKSASPMRRYNLEAFAKPPSSVLQAQYSEASIQYSESETLRDQRIVDILTPDFSLANTLEGF